MVCDYYSNPDDPQCVLQNCRQNSDCLNGFICDKNDYSEIKHGECIKCNLFILYNITALNFE